MLDAHGRPAGVEARSLMGLGWRWLARSPVSLAFSWIRLIPIKKNKARVRPRLNLRRILHPIGSAVLLRAEHMRLHFTN